MHFRERVEKEQVSLRQMFFCVDVNERIVTAADDKHALYECVPTVWRQALDVKHSTTILARSTNLLAR